jgi:hypothetical protein
MAVDRILLLRGGPIGYFRRSTLHDLPQWHDQLTYRSADLQITASITSVGLIMFANANVRLKDNGFRRRLNHL